MTWVNLANLEDNYRGKEAKTDLWSAVLSRLNSKKDGSTQPA
jgi:hypothetical protein